MTTMDLTVPTVNELPPFASRLSLIKDGREALALLKANLQRWLLEEDDDPDRDNIRGVIAKYREHDDWPISVSYNGAATDMVEQNYYSYQDGLFFRPTYNLGSMDEIIIHVMTIRDIDCDTIQATVKGKKSPQARLDLSTIGYCVTPVSRHSVFSGARLVPRGTEADWKLDGDRLVRSGGRGESVRSIDVYLKVCDGYYRSQMGDIIQLVDELPSLV